MVRYDKTIGVAERWNRIPSEKRGEEMKPMLCSLIALFQVTLALGAAAPQWTFDEPDAEVELKNWIDLNDLEPLRIETVKDQSGIERKVLITKSLGGDPYMFPGGGWNVADYEPFSGKEYPVLYLGVRVNKPDRWQVYWVSKEDTAWSEAQHQDFIVEAVDKFEDLAVEITAGGWQDKTILRFRIDPGTSPGVMAEIDYISFSEPIPPGGAYPVRLKSSLPLLWGELKRR